jgi:hypothetical protein
VTPDKWKDYPHHYGKSGSIQKHITEARKFFLKGDLPNAFFSLGVVLHYIQDAYTSLSPIAEHQVRWEQQIEQASFVDDLEELVRSTFQDHEDRIDRYTELIRLLSEEIEGEQKTLDIAKLPETELGFWDVCIGASPDVDLNFALKTSLVIAKSVLGSKTYPKLQTELANLLMEYENMLRETEIVFVSKIVKLIEKRDDLKKRRKNGIFTTLRNCFLVLSGKIHNLRVRSKIKKYEQQKHLKAIVRAYQETAERRIDPYSNWYNTTIPEIDIGIVKKELLSIHDASEHFGTSENLIKKRKISCYRVRDIEYIRNSEVKKVLRK